MLHIQHFLASNSLADLQQQYGVKHRRHTKHPNLVLLKYDQIASPMGEPLVRECRGIVLDEANGWAVVARAFDKFFNHGEGHAAEIDWSTARVQEKMDGSLCMLYHYADEWHVATTGTPDGCGDVNRSGMRFSDLFWETFHAQKLSLPLTTSVLIFEFTSQYNRIIVRHAAPRLTLLAARSTVDWREVPVRSLEHILPTVPEHPLVTLKDALDTFQTLDPLKTEGYVIVDAAFNRIKVKHPGYVALHHMKGNGLGPTDKRLLEVIRSGESPELLAAFPEWTADVERIRAAYDGLCAELANAYAEWKDIPVQKDFALKATTTRCSGALFSVRSGKCAGMTDFLRKMNVDALVRTLGLKDAPEEEAA